MPAAPQAAPVAPVARWIGFLFDVLRRWEEKLSQQRLWSGSIRPVEGFFLGQDGFERQKFLV